MTFLILLSSKFALYYSLNESLFKDNTVKRTITQRKIRNRIDRQAEEMFSRLVKQMAEMDGVTEELKAADPMEWVGRMNNIRSRAMEIVNSELIYI